MFHKTFYFTARLLVCACLSGIAEISSAQHLATDQVILITGDTLKGQIKQLSDAGTITLIPEKTTLERVIDKRFINLARLSSGSTIYTRKNQVSKYRVPGQGQCAVFPFSRQLESSIGMIFPELVRRSFITNYNNEVNRQQPELFEASSSEIPSEHKRLKKIFDAYAYATAAVLCLVEPTDGSKVKWHFYAKPISRSIIKSMLSNSNFELIEERSFRVGEAQISESKIPFRMSFNSIDSCAFVQNGKKQILRYRIMDQSKIGFVKYGRSYDTETIYDIVYVEGPVMRYSIFDFEMGGFLTRTVLKENMR